MHMAYIIPTSIIETICTSLPHIASYYSMLPPCGKYDLTDHSHAMIMTVIACNLLHLNEIPSLPNTPRISSRWDHLKLMVI